MPLQATSGAASYDAFGGGVAAVPNYIEDVFSTWLYTGNGSTQTITNGIDLAGKGGMVWIKSRSNATSNTVFDTVRGATKFVTTDTTNNQDTISDTLTAFNSTGFTLGSDALDGKVNTSPRTYASWTFREQPKFFTCLTYTGNGVAGRQIAHDLGSVPGFIVVKRVDNTGGWPSLHRNDGTNWRQLYLNSTNNGTAPSVNWFGDGTSFVAPTSTNFTVGANSDVNASGWTYVAYLFAHNAGGFGLSGTDNVISCGSFTTDGSGNATIDLGYEPQWLLVKQSSGSGGFWRIWDTMRGWSVATLGGSTADLYPNSSAAENFGGANVNGGFPTATGFYANGGVFNTSQTHIYIAIRRGPMATPTTGISVFDANYTTGGGTSGKLITTNFPVDASISSAVLLSGSATTSNRQVFDRLRGSTQGLRTNATDAESTLSAGIGFASNTAIFDQFWNTTVTAIYWNFRRAPGFFDVVCYTGTGSNQNVTHNLGVVPELMIHKTRNVSSNWTVYVAGQTNVGAMNVNWAFSSNATVTSFFGGLPTSTFFRTDAGNSSVSGENYVTYLFASCPGVSRVGSYTGTGTTQVINCGFTGGARFVMIKRTDSTGDWYVWDTARGIVSGNDPHLSLNTTAAEVTSNDTIDTDSTGFVVNQVSATNVNVSSATYIFLAIA